MKPYFETLFKRNICLSEYTTFRIGGPAKFLCVADCAEEVVYAAKEANKNRVRYHVLGEGSNTLASDSEIEAAIIIFKDNKQPFIIKNTEVVVSGGTSLGSLVNFCTDNSLEGLSELAGIPGTVGGAIYGNAGAYGKTISDTLVSLKILETDGSVKEVSSSEINFSYRYSDLRNTGKVILEACFALNPGKKSEIQAKINKTINDRKLKHPDSRYIKTAGSFFKNIPPKEGETKRKAAGKLLEEVGALDLRIGDAGLWHKHANIVVNFGNATAKDVKDLANEMTLRVKKHFGIELEREVNYLD